MDDETHDEPINPNDQVSKEKRALSWRTYRVPFGQFRGMSLDEIGVLRAGKYVDWLVNDARRRQEELSEEVLEFVKHYQEYAIFKIQEGR